MEATALEVMAAKVANGLHAIAVELRQRAFRQDWRGCITLMATLAEESDANCAVLEEVERRYREPDWVLTEWQIIRALTGPSVMPQVSSEDDTGGA